MKPLKKSERGRFDALCKTIRDALLIDHLQQEYIFSDKDDGNIATTHVLSQGWRLKVSIKPEFWTLPYKDQVLSLIHEHIHVVLHPYHQAFDTVQTDWVSPHCRTQVQDINHQSAEIVVDHLTEVVFRLIRDRIG